MLRFITLIVLITFTIPPVHAQDRVIRVVTLEAPPYVSENMPGKGWAWDICDTVLREAGYYAKLEILPWARAVFETKTGLADALYLANINEERRTWALFTDPVGDEISVAFKRRDTAVTFNAIGDLARYDVAGLRDAHVSNLLLAASVDLHQVGTLQQGFRMLFFARVDALVVDGYMGRHILNTLMPPIYAATIDFVEKPVDSNKLHLAISLKYPDRQQLREDFNRGLAELRSSGRFEEILHSHGF